MDRGNRKKCGRLHFHAGRRRYEIAEQQQQKKKKRFPVGEKEERQKIFGGERKRESSFARASERALTGGKEASVQNSQGRGENFIWQSG